MSAVSAEMVRQLREATGAGMMDCKKALVECSSDMEKAADFLRIKSGAKAGKVSGRSALEGRLGFATYNNTAALVEINCETDFVARGEAFAEFCQTIAAAAANADADDLAGLALSDGRSGEQARSELVMQVGENVSFGRVCILKGDAINHYMHTGDKIGAIVQYEGGNAELARELCMHIAAMRPSFLDLSAVPEDEQQRERKIIKAQAAESGKPAQVIDKMVEGRLKKHFAERTLFLQPYVKDGNITVGDAATAGGMKLLAFRWIVVGGGNA